MTQTVLADLRRLYHHMINDGEWNGNIDCLRLAQAIRTIEELSEGNCRRHCTTSKAQFARGAEWAIGFLPDDWEEAYTELKGREKWKTSSTK